MSASSPQDERAGRTPVSRGQGRVLVVTNDFPPRAGGIQTYVDAVLGHLDPDRLVVHANHQDGAVAHDRRLPYPVVRDPAALLLPGPGLAGRVRQTARRFGATAAWFPSAAPLGLLAPSLRAVGVQTVVASAHGHEVWWSRFPVSRTALRVIGDRVDVLSVDSAAVRRRVVAALRPAAAARAVLLAPGVDADRFAVVRDAEFAVAHEAECSVARGEDVAVAREQDHAAAWPGRAGRTLGRSGPVVLCLSRAVPRKGHVRLLDVWPDLLRRHPGARLVLAGEGPELPRMRRRAAGLPGVSVLGGVGATDLPGLYARADVFVLPVVPRLGGLVTESLGIVLLEAAAAGLPVVAGRAGGTVEAVLTDRTGLLVDASDPAALTVAVERLLGDPALRRRWGAAGASWVRQAWTWERTAHRLELLLAGESVPRW